MPFDGTDYDTPALRRARLAERLREVPPSAWDFTDGNRCAMPVAKVLFGDRYHKALGLSPWQVIRIFGVFAPFRSRFYSCPSKAVTPSMVANALESIGQAKG